MSLFTRYLAVALVGLSMPFSAWALSTNADIAPGLSVWDADEQPVFELPPGVAPPECERKSPGDEAGTADAHPAACCWVYYFGRYWCVAC